jgi:hypothetical protein
MQVIWDGVKKISVNRKIREAVMGWATNQTFRPIVNHLSSTKLRIQLLEFKAQMGSFALD